MADKEYPFSDLTEDKIKFITEKCESVIESLIKDRESLQKKANLLLGIIGGAITLSVGVLLNPDLTLGNFSKHFLFAESGALIVLAVILICSCLLPSGYAVNGGEPNQLLKSDYITQKYPEMLAAYCLGLQTRIDTNRDRNNSAGKWIKGIAAGLFSSPLVAILIAWVVLEAPTWCSH